MVRTKVQSFVNSQTKKRVSKHTNKPQSEKATCGKGGNIYQLYIWKGAPEYIVFHIILFHIILHYIPEYIRNSYNSIAKKPQSDLKIDIFPKKTQRRPVST